MLVVMEHGALTCQIESVMETAKQAGYEARPIPGGERVAVGILYNDGVVDADKFLSLPGVREVIPVTRPYKLVSREFKREDTIVKVGNTTIGKGCLVMMAGPCAVESREQAISIANEVKKSGASIFRGGAYKPRTSPYAFQGLGLEGLKILSEVRKSTGLSIVTEALDGETLGVVAEYADIVQIGARNMQNFSLLKKAGKIGKPILLKRGISATIEEWLMAAEYILEAGNSEVILCERGIRTYNSHTRNMLDVSAIPYVKKESHLPVIADPSHSAGKREQVTPLACAAVSAGADGLIVEVHDKPEKALSDGSQSLYPRQFEILCRKVNGIFNLLKEFESQEA